MKAIFLGKFQPPHLGHIRTILNVAKEYSKVTIGITKGTPKILEYDEVKRIFDDVFKGYESINVVIIEGTIEGNTSNIDKQDFDVIVSGNNKVLEILKSKGYSTKFQKRTGGIGYSGSELRALVNGQNNIVPEHRNDGFKLEILLTSQLKPLEKVLPSHFHNLEKALLSDNIIKKPIIVDKDYNIVLDGSHRYAFLVKHGFKYAPIIKVDYNDESIFVGNHLKHRYIQDETYIISKSEVISRGVNENLFDARTTRHFFPFRKDDFPVDLEVLEQGIEKDISYLIEDGTVENEIEKDLHYIEEIDEELNILKLYIEEQKEVKEYLMKQIIEMKKSTFN